MSVGQEGSNQHATVASRASPKAWWAILDIAAVVLATPVMLGCLYVAFAIVYQEVIWPAERSRIATQIVKAYREKAVEGKVARPVSDGAGVYVWARCNYSIPLTVHVTTAGGSNYAYQAIGHPQSDSGSKSWTFQILWADDENGERVYPPEAAATSTR